MSTRLQNSALETWRLFLPVATICVQGLTKTSRGHLMAASWLSVNANHLCSQDSCGLGHLCQKVLCFFAVSNCLPWTSFRYISENNYFYINYKVTGGSTCSRDR